MKWDRQLDRRSLKNSYRAPFKIVILLRLFNLHYSDQGIVNSGYFKMVSFF